jgi:hypothetical protein
MSPSSPTFVRLHEKCRLCARNKPQQGRVVNICWYLSTPSQDGWKPSPLDWESPRRGQVPVKQNHPMIWNTCVYWLRQWASLCDWGGTVNDWKIKNNLKATHSLLLQSTGKPECINRTLKLQLKKVCQESHPVRSITARRFAEDRSSPTKWMGLSPFKILFGCPPPLVKVLWRDLKEIGDLTQKQLIQALELMF